MYRQLFSIPRLYLYRQFVVILLTIGITLWTGTYQTKERRQSSLSIEQKTRVHRLASKQRSPFDAFVYVNRIPEKLEEGETTVDYVSRVFSRLANQEGRILLKMPPGMSRDAYEGFKTFLNDEGKSSAGNCASCHTPPTFTNNRKYVGSNGGKERTPTLRNSNADRKRLTELVQAKMKLANQKRANPDNAVDKAYANMHLNDKDVAQLVKFLELLRDVPDDQFRKLILESEVIDTSDSSR